jgi:hypothetical protein
VQALPQMWWGIKTKGSEKGASHNGGSEPRPDATAAVAERPATGGSPAAGDRKPPAIRRSQANPVPSRAAAFPDSPSILALARADAALVGPHARGSTQATDPNRCRRGDARAALGAGGRKPAAASAPPSRALLAGQGEGCGRTDLLPDGAAAPAPRPRPTLSNPYGKNKAEEKPRAISPQGLSLPSPTYCWQDETLDKKSHLISGGRCPKCVTIQFYGGQWRVDIREVRRDNNPLSSLILVSTHCCCCSSTSERLEVVWPPPFKGHPSLSTSFMLFVPS